jgi:hypothetical protein
VTLRESALVVSEAVTHQDASAILGPSSPFKRFGGYLVVRSVDTAHGRIFNST